MKTILIPIFQGSEAKNILRNDIFMILRSQSDVRIVLLVPTEEKKRYFEAEFHGENIIYKVVDRFQPSFFDGVFSFLKKNLINTATATIKRKNFLKAGGNHLKYWFEFFISKLFARRFFREVIRWMDQGFVRDNRSIDIFNTFSPSLVFTAHIFGDMEASLLKEAKKRGIKTIGLINSWDKITSRGMVRTLPERLIVHNEIIKKEALKHIDFDEENVVVVGIPHYDIFKRSAPCSREAFYKKIGAHLRNRIIVLCPIGSYFSDVDSEMINTISEFKVKKMIPEDTQILVRFPPNDEVNTESLKNKDILLFDQPGKRFGTTRGIDWDMNDEDIQHLLDTLSYVALIVCHVSTMVIDAAVFDKPIINYDYQDKGLFSKGKDPRWLYQTEHFGNIIQTNGTQIVKNKDEMLRWINLYLNDPSVDREGRRALVGEQCGPFDGKAGERTASYILKYLNT